jgi:glyoxylase-like metal-dependent hydrolase (beta-lactamase superfamily II)
MLTRRRFLATTSAATAALWIPLMRARSLPSGEGFTAIRGNVGTFSARGGTIGWLATEKELVVVDAQFPDTAAACWSALNAPIGRRIDLLVNTHHHGDHTSGNGVFAPHAATHLAHENCPMWQRKQAEAQGKLAEQVLPSTTFKNTWSQKIGDETVRLDYFGAAHTSGDAVVHFEKADVVHMGDLVFNRFPCFIDRPAGASIGGWISVLEKVHAAHTDETRFIFGHAAPSAGITGGRADLLVMRDFLTGLLEYTRAGLAAGKTVDELASVERLPAFPDHYSDTRKTRIPDAIRVAAEELAAKE